MKIKIRRIFWLATVIFSLNMAGFPLLAEPLYSGTHRTRSIHGYLPENLEAGTPHLPQNIYLVVGVFALKSNAEKFADFATKNGFPAQFSLNDDNNYYYVYLHSSSNWEESKAHYQEVISSTSIFPGMWLFDYKQDVVTQEKPVGPQEAPIEDTTLQVQRVEEIKAPRPASSSTKKLNTSVDSLKFHKDEEDYLIYPNVIFAKNYNEITAKVQIIDPVRSKLIKTVNAHELSVLQDPNNGSHAIQLIADVFGYRKVQHDFLLNDLNADSISSFIFLRGDTILIEFPLERLKTGDVATMYNVFFRNDAVVMESRSQYELNSLLEMLKENDDYQIVIHGHTNGNKRGKIIALAEENPNFFVITEENKTSSGSAKKLSTERAMTIKKYLVANGISEDRMTVVGWGGKKMIYDKYSVDAKKNVRVEIEILQD